ncbi:MAG: hypothetical protein WBB45_21350 [Cyclobacteriaceae bacterium]
MKNRVLPLAVLLLLGSGVCVYFVQEAIVQVAGSHVMRLYQLIITVFILLGLRELVAIRGRAEVDGTVGLAVKSNTCR